MKPRGSLRVNTLELAKALKEVVVLNRRGGRMISLEFKTNTSVLWIREAEYAIRATSISASGSWPRRIVVSGEDFRKVSEKLPRNTQIELVAMEAELCILTGAAQIRIPRDRGSGLEKINPKPLPKNPKHKGPVAQPPAPVGKRVELSDSWNFSARVPMPQHRDTKR